MEFRVKIDESDGKLRRVDAVSAEAAMRHVRDLVAGDQPLRLVFVTPDTGKPARAAGAPRRDGQDAER